MWKEIKEIKEKKKYEFFIGNYDKMQKEIVKNKSISWYLYLFQHQLFNYIN